MAVLLAFQNDQCFVPFKCDMCGQFFELGDPHGIATSDGQDWRVVCDDCMQAVTLGGKKGLIRDLRECGDQYAAKMAHWLADQTLYVCSYKPPGLGEAFYAGDKKAIKAVVDQADLERLWSTIESVEQPLQQKCPPPKTPSATG